MDTLSDDDGLQIYDTADVVSMQSEISDGLALVMDAEQKGEY